MKAKRTEILLAAAVFNAPKSHSYNLRRKMAAWMRRKAKELESKNCDWPVDGTFRARFYA